MARLFFQRHTKTTDEELVKLFQKNESLEVLGELYNRYLEWVYGICMKYFKNVEDSQDASMEVYELLIKRLPGKDVENFKPWLYRVASNYCLDALRKKKSVKNKESEIQLMHSNESIRLDSDAYDIESELTKMEDCLEILNSEQKQSVELFYLEKKSYDEVSRILNVSWSKTRSFIQNGRRNLKLCMDNKS